MMAATSILPALPEAGFDADSVDLELDLDLDDIARAVDADCGRASFSYHRLPDDDLDDMARAPDADCISALTCGRASFSYHRLPEPLLRLTVRRIDGSFFDVQIARTAAVWELKAAIEGLFVAAFDVPWQHVWSHFCLCFKDEKLTDDKATLRAFGIKDGDELHFVQHLSIDYTPCKSSKSQRTASHRRSRTSVDDLDRSRTSVDDFNRSRTSVDDFNRSSTLLDDLNEEDEGVKKLANTRHSTSVLEEGLCLYQHHGECVEESRKKGCFLNSLFSYSRLRSKRRTYSEDVVQSPREKKSTRSKLGKWLPSKNQRTEVNETQNAIYLTCLLSEMK